MFTLNWQMKKLRLRGYIIFIDHLVFVNVLSMLYGSSQLVLSMIFWGRRQWHPTPVLLPEKSHGRRSLVGCSPWGCWGSDTTEWLHFHFSLSCIGEGNGNPLHHSCLENPTDGGAWWAAVHGVAKSWTRLSDFTFSFHFHTLEKEIATHSNVLAWRIPGTVEPGGVPSVGSHRVGHDRSDLAAHLKEYSYLFLISTNWF